MSALAMNAVPAKPGLWKTISLTDGTTVQVRLVGDEFVKYYQAADGTKYVSAGDGTYKVLGDTETSARRKVATSKRSVLQKHQNIKKVRKNASIFQGKKKGLVILANFTDVKFASGHDAALYNNILNGEGYSANGFKGSVKDYFRDQSNGAFELDFDVVGPCPLAHNMKYYGANDAETDDDVRAGEMVAEACNWAHTQGVNFSDYDWDGDGYVDQVFVLYAGQGEADGGSDDTIWPHMFYLSASDYGKELKLDGVTVDTYACSNELDYYKSIEGIGTFCHEFSHCMGFPDLYDTDYEGWYGMGNFDLMCSGSYNGDGFVPAGYSAYEKNECGWITLHDMTNITEEQEVTGLKPISEGGDAYILKNKANANEYYIVENRQKTGWDAQLPGKGVMVTYVDYDEDVWSYNVPNTKNGEYYDVYGNLKSNDHQRLTIFHADNTASERNESTDLYPYGTRNSLTKTSTPSATLYNKNSDGTKYMHIAINDMAIASDRTASMTFAPYSSSDTPVTPSGPVLFYESFDQCDGKGGNDGSWSNVSNNGSAKTDNEGWSSTAFYPAYQCAKVGTSKKKGTVTTPTFTVNGKAALTFKAGAWDSTSDGTTLTLSTSNGTLSSTIFTIDKGAWTDCTADLTADGDVKITISTSAGRFFLDEVKVIDANTTAIEDLMSDKADKQVVGYYSVNGMRLSAPQAGLNIVKYADGTTRKIMIVK